LIDPPCTMESLGSGSSPAGNTFHRWVLPILLVGLMTRAAVVVYAGQHPAMFEFPDTRRYLAVARNLACGRGPVESETVRAGTDPLYPALLSLGVFCGLETDDQLLRFGRLINTLAGLAAIILVASTGRRIADSRAGLIAALIAANDPMMNFFNALVLTETCYITLLLGAIAALCRYCQTRSLADVGIAGLLLGLGTLTRSTSLLLPFLLVPIVWLMSAAPLARRAAALSVLLFSVCIVLLPATVRNYRLFGHFIPVRTGGGASLMEALGPWADGGPGMNRINYPTIPPDANEFERDRICREAALDWARHNPSRVMSLAAEKLCGAWLMRRQPPVLGLLLAPAIYFSLVHMVFVGSVRYRLPAMPFLFILSAVALDRILTLRFPPPAARKAGVGS
jgi:4-amino-4-deoxy-L-arabinose transferase-like glycosyltransferase